MSEPPPTTTVVEEWAAGTGAMGAGRMGKLNPTSVLSSCSICSVTGGCVCVLGGVKENNKQNKKFKVGWPFSVA